MRILRVISGPLAAAAMLLPGLTRSIAPSAAAQAPRCNVSNTDPVPDGEEQAALDQINQFRGQNGLGPVAISPALTLAARWKSGSMADGAPFAHDDTFRSWVQRLSDCGYPMPDWVTENLAAGYGNAGATVQQWIDSGYHRENMLNGRVRFIGIARAQGGPYGWYWTADFGASFGGIN